MLATFQPGPRLLRWRATVACIVAFLALVPTQTEGASTTDQPTAILIVGAPGEAEFGKNFLKWAGQWEETCRQAGVKLVTIGQETNQSAADLERLQQALHDEPKESPAELWLVLLGHGTFDGREAKFNLRGPDFSATELAGWLKPFRRPLAVINTASASGPFLAKLSASGRVVITATRSGHEQNYTRFGQYFTESVTDPAADLDKDGQTSLLEAYLTAARRAAEFYESEGRLATEHALLDDNGDSLGTPPDWFRGIRAVKKAKDGAALDGFRAHQFHLLRSDAEQRMPPALRARRDELELTILKLRENKNALAEDDYYRQLEVLLLDTARLYETKPAAR
jgi:hypothetical protein